MIKNFFFGILNLVNGVSNTVWGVIILFWAMYILVHHENSSAAAYYFAGVASTLLGIKQEHPQTTNITDSTIRTSTPISTQNNTNIPEITNEGKNL